MAKHTQTISRLLPVNYLSVFDHFEGLALKGLGTEKTGIRICFTRFSDVCFANMKQILAQNDYFFFQKSSATMGFQKWFPSKRYTRIREVLC